MCYDLMHQDIRAKSRWLGCKIGITESKYLVVNKKDQAFDNNKRPSSIADSNPVMNTNSKLIENENEAHKLRPRNNIARVHPITINSNKGTLHQRTATTKIN